MTDLIRRQDAINVIDDMFMEDAKYKEWLRNDINSLPSAPMDAIPIEWLYALAELAEKKESETDIKLSLMIKGVVALWHREQEEENENS